MAENDRFQNWITKCPVHPAYSPSPNASADENKPKDDCLRCWLIWSYAYNQTLPAEHLSRALAVLFMRLTDLGIVAQRMTSKSVALDGLLRNLSEKVKELGKPNGDPETENAG